jgi:virginiamycin B lyase
MQSPGSIPRHTAVKLFPLPRNDVTPTSTRRPLIARACSGSLGRTASTAGSQIGHDGMFDAPRGAGLCGIASTPDGQVFFASLAGSYLGQIDLGTGGVTGLEPPVPRQGAQRVCNDSHGVLWITGWNSGDLFRYDSKAKNWARWNLPDNGRQPMPSMSTRPTGCGTHAD